MSAQASPARAPLSFGLAAWGAALTGGLYFLAFPGFGLWPLAYLAFAPFYVLLRGQTPRRAVLLGLVAGTVQNVGGFYWLQTMLASFSGFPGRLCAIFTLILCAYQGGRLALFGWLVARGERRGWPFAWTFFAAFAASELCYPLLFPWYFAAAVHQVTPLLQLAEIGGPILVGLPIVAVGTALGELVLARRDRRRPDVRLLGGAAAAALVQVAFGLVRVPQIDARQSASEALHVGAVQGNMGLMQKREDPNEGLRRHLQLTQELRAKGAELVVWSESSATFPMRESMYRRPIHDYVGRHLGVPAVVGGVLYRTDPDRQRYFNVALSLDARGEVLARYDKQFLLAFGEYLPFGDTFPILYQWSPNSGKFTPGTSLDPLVLEVHGRTVKATTLICYEDILPGFTNAAVRHADPELLLNMTNDAWFGDTTEPWEHLALAQFRSVEHRRWLVRSTNSGVSAFVDAAGRVVAQGGTFRAEHVDAQVRLMRGRTAYELLGDKPWVVVAILSVFGAFVRRRRGA